MDEKKRRVEGEKDRGRTKWRERGRERRWTAA